MGGKFDLHFEDPRFHENGSVGRAQFVQGGLRQLLINQLLDEWYMMFRHVSFAEDRDALQVVLRCTSHLGDLPVELLRNGSLCLDHAEMHAVECGFLHLLELLAHFCRKLGVVCYLGEELF